MTLYRQHLSSILRALGVVFLLGTTCGGQSPNSVSGFVLDQHGASIPNASVEFTEASGSRVPRTTLTNNNGQFRFDDSPDRRGTLKVSAKGFRESVIVLSGSSDEVQVVLSPATVGGVVTITRSETRIEDSASSIVALDRSDLETTAAATLDDRLRQVPGFSLFRRSGSRTANPTTQGVSLRGVGASGASRSLVLLDGIPLNDPFGGWIFWGRVPSESISQVEVLRGPSSDLYGGSAIGGVISVRTRTPGSAPLAGIELSYGTQDTLAASAYASDTRWNWAGSIAGEFFRTDGYVIVDQAQRGTADTKANVERSVVIPFVQRSLDEGRVFASAEFFQEMRGNGTRLQTNDTRIRNFATGVDWHLTPHQILAIRTNGGTQNYHQTFSAIASGRNSETLNRLQHVPVDFFGGYGQWTGTFGGNVLFAGFDARTVRGHSDEVGLVSGFPASTTDAGGRETTYGIFTGAVLPFRSRFTLSGSVRVDWWRNARGFSRTISLASGAVTSTSFPDRSESAVSPRVSALYRATGNISLAASFGRGFRRPTLNELYRNFRVGDVITLANANLRAERATGFDAALIGNAFGQRLYTRTGVFCTRISENVSNVTLNVSPTLIVRQRFNVGRTRACGVEVDLDHAPTGRLRISGGYLYVDSRVTSFPANPSQEGLRIPQVARHQFAVHIAYLAPRLATLAAQIRAVGQQYDDDQNQFRLRAFTTVDMLASRRLSRNLEAFFAAENVFDTRIEAGRTPVLTLGTPRTFRVGMRLRFGKN